jgi:nitroreductase
MQTSQNAQTLSAIIASRRSVRDFLPTPIAPELLNAVLADAVHSPSWSNTQPYMIAVASGAVRDRLYAELTERFDTGMRAQRQGWLGKLKLLASANGRKARPDGDFDTTAAYPDDLQPRRRDTGQALYKLLGIDRNDLPARDAQMRKNFEFFGAPTAIFVFAHGGLREFAVLDAGIFVQTLMLSAHAHGLGSCAQGALATWGSPVRREFDVPKAYKLICGISIGHPSGHVINQFNPGRSPVDELLIKQKAYER